MLRRTTFCWTTGLVCVLGLGLPSSTYGDDPKPPPREPPPPTIDDERTPGPEEGPGSMPPPELREPLPEAGERFEGQRPPERRLFGRQHARPTYESLPEEEQFRLDEFIQKYFPELFEELTRLDKEKPAVFSATVNRVLPEMLRLMRVEHEDPETFPLQVEEVRISTRIRALARRISRDREQDRGENRVPELRQLLEHRFDLRQQIHRIEVERLARRLTEARERLDRTAADKEEIIAHELEEILAPPHPGKESPPPPRKPAPPREENP